jgi:hypothetical protein
MLIYLDTKQVWVLRITYAPNDHASVWREPSSSLARVSPDLPNPEPQEALAWFGFQSKTENPQSVIGS